MNVNRIDYFGTTLIDLSADTVTADTLAEGITAHDASGAVITGVLQSGTGAIGREETANANGIELSITGVDLSADTVSADSLLAGYTAHDAAGQAVTGTAAADDSLTLSLMDGSITSISSDIQTARQYAFAGCVSLLSASLPNLSSVSYYCFSACSKLESAYFPSATNIASYAFNGCKKLTSLSIPLVENISQYAFQDCTLLESFDIPNVLTLGASVFRNCQAVTTLSLTRITSVPTNCFYACRNLSTLILGGSSVVSLANTNAFYKTPIESGIGYIYVPDSLVEEYEAAANWSTFAGQIKPLSEYTEV